MAEVAHVPRAIAVRPARPAGRATAGQSALRRPTSPMSGARAAARGRQQLSGAPAAGQLRSVAKQQVAKNAGYDEMVRDLLTLPINRRRSHRPILRRQRRPARWPSTPPRSSSRKTWPPARPGCSSASASSAPSATIIPSPSGSASSSGASPPSSPASDRSGPWTCCCPSSEVADSREIDHSGHRTRRPGDLPRRHASRRGSTSPTSRTPGRLDDFAQQSLLRPRHRQPPVGPLLRHRLDRSGR